MDRRSQRFLRHQHRAVGDGVQGGHDPATSQDSRMRFPKTRREMLDRVGNELGRAIQRRLDVDSCHPVPSLPFDSARTSCDTR